MGERTPPLFARMHHEGLEGQLVEKVLLLKAAMDTRHGEQQNDPRSAHASAAVTKMLATVRN
ncbi:MAG: hypothetical protein IPO12_04565 [Flavobacteriales bacterium]|nr:hypothetical protein [Flavobacteriales bacterium]